MARRVVASLLLAAWLLAGAADGGRVLGIFQLHARSHFAMFEAVLKEMAARGHSVDVVSHFPLKDPPPRYRDLSVKGSLKDLNFSMALAPTLGTVKSSMEFFFDANVDFCEVIIQQPALQELLRSNATYDLVVTELFGVDCMLGFAHRFRAASAQMISAVMLPWGNDRVANPDNAATVPLYYMPLAPPMAFWERAYNALMLLFFKVNHYRRSELPANSFIQRHFGADTPSVWELQRNVSLILVNSHFSLHGARATVPAFVEVAGAHIPPTKPLPEELSSWLDGAGPAGAVYFSFGSLVHIESAEPARLRSIAAALGALPQRVLWKADPARLPPLPPNVMARAWMPQADVLAHPSVVAFVTHGGLMGTLEALTHGVPLVVAPFFGDQHFNAFNYRQRGVAVEIDGGSFAGQELLAALRTITTDPGYRKRAQELARILSDRPHPPLQEAVFWLEYVMRHRGAPHMQSAAVHLAWWQDLLLDVAAAVVLAVLCTGLLSYVCIRRCFHTGHEKVSSVRNGVPKRKVN